MDYCGIQVVHWPSLKKDGLYPFCNIFGRYSQLLGEEALCAAADKCLDHKPSLENLVETRKLRIVYYKTELCERTIIRVLSPKTGHGYNTSAHLLSPNFCYGQKRERLFSAS